MEEELKFGLHPAEWDRLVKRGIGLNESDQRIRWSIADLLLAATPKRLYHVGGKSAEEESTGFTLREALEAFSQEAGIDLNGSSLLAYRQNAIAWPTTKRRLDASWSAHCALCAHPDRYNLIRAGMTHKIATELAGRAPTKPRAVDYKERAEPHEITALVSWASRLVAKADTLTKNSKFTYKERWRQKEVLETLQFRLDELRRSTIDAENYKADGHQKLLGNQNAKGRKKETV